MKTSEPPSSTGGPATAPPSGNNKSKSKGKSILKRANGKVSTPLTTQVQTKGAAMVIMSAASAAIIEAVHALPNGNDSLATTDRDEFVREVLTLIHVRRFSSFHLWPWFHFPCFNSIDRFLLRGPALDGVQ